MGQNMLFAWPTDNMLCAPSPTFARSSSAAIDQIDCDDNIGKVWQRMDINLILSPNDLGPPAVSSRALGFEAMIFSGCPVTLAVSRHTETGARLDT